MFGKKVLGLISLLFLGSQLSSVRAAETCKITFTAATTGADAAPALCTQSNCAEGYYAVFSAGSVVEPNTTGGENGYLVYVNGSNGCEPKDEIGYFKSPDNKYISNSYQGKAKMETPKSDGCITNNIGLLVNDGVNNVLCLDYYEAEKKAVTIGFDTTSEKYLLKYDNTNGVLFTGSSTGRIAIAPTSNSLILDSKTTYDSNGVYCDYLENKVVDRMVNFCSGTILNFLYKCSSGLCTQETSKFTDTVDYLVTINDKNKIYKSSTSGGVTSFAFQKDETGAKAFKVVATDNTYFEPINDAALNSLTESTDPTELTEAITTSGIRLYDCHNGICTLTSGYAKFGNTPALGKFTVDGSTGTWELVITSETCATSNTDEGNVLLDSTNLKLCVDPNTNNFSTISDDSEYFLLKNSKYYSYLVNGNVIVASSTKPTVGYYLIANGNILITSAGDASKLISCDGTDCTEVSTFAAGYYLSGHDQGLIECETANTAGSCSIHTVTTGYYANAVSGKALLSCDGTNCEAVDTAAVGYYQNGETGAANKYIQCTTTTTCALIGAGFAASCEGDSNIGKLTNNGSLCLGDSKTATFGTNRYLIKYDSGSIFNEKVVSTKFGVVKATVNSLILDTSVSGQGVCVKDADNIITTDAEAACSTGKSYYPTCDAYGVCSATETVCNPQTGADCLANTYYLATGTSSTEVIKTSVLANTSTGYVFYCAEAGKQCIYTSEAGYYVNSKTQAFYCNGVEGQCKSADKNNLILAGCTANGGLYVSGGYVYLCLDKADDTINIKLDDGAGNYLANYEESNIFGIPEDEYGMITVTANKAVLNKTYDNKLPYAYVQKSTLKVLVRGEICPDKADMMEITYNENGICVDTKSD